MVIIKTAYAGDRVHGGKSDVSMDRLVTRRCAHADCNDISDAGNADVYVDVA